MNAKTLLLIALLLSLLIMTGCATAPENPQRYGMVIGLKPEKIVYYKELHANTWPGVLEQITACNIQDYSIYLIELEPGKHYLFSYFEYVGDDFDADMAKMAEDAETQRWWKETNPCQFPIITAKEGEWWASMEEVFHHE